MDLMNNYDVCDFLPSLDDDTEIMTHESVFVKRICSPRLKLGKREALSLPIDCNLPLLKSSRYTVSSHYHTLKKIGSGTYSEVCSAIDKETEQQVALKISKGSTSINLLKNEADLLKLVTPSDYLPKFYNFNQDPVSNKAYLAMEYIEGKPLDAFVREHGVLSEEIGNQLVLQLIKAVEELHSHGIAHRDIKPQNILITDDLSLKLIDLNVSKLSRFLTHSSKSDCDSKFRYLFFTQISTPLYAAPELTGFNFYTESIDIWGIGVAYISMLTDTLKCKELGCSTIQVALENLDMLSTLSEFSMKILKSICCSDPDSRPNISELRAIFEGKISSD